MNNFINLQRDNEPFEGYSGGEIPVFKQLHNNSIMVIHPYKEGNAWMFDDEATGLVKEGLVGGTDKLCDIISKGNNKFTAIFSSSYFPGADVLLSLLSTEMDGQGGSTYYTSKYMLECWLCPNLLRYFKTPPQNIYIQVK